MRRRTVSTLLAISIPQLFGVPARADRLSTFDTGTDGWTPVDLAYPAVGSPPPVLNVWTATWSPTGGNPGGHVSRQDPSANVVYWRAPAPWLGNQSPAYAGTLSFDLRYTGSAQVFDQEDVVLVGPSNLTLVYDAAPTPDPTWRNYTVPLSETGWHRDSLTGPAATAADLQSALGALSALYIRGEFRLDNDDTAYLDNVRLTFAHLPGDTPSYDNGIDLDDLNHVLNNFGTNNPAGLAWPKTTGTVDLNDLNAVLNNFGNHAAPSSLVIPEPIAMACLFAGLPLIIRRRRN